MRHAYLAHLAVVVGHDLALALHEREIAIVAVVRAATPLRSWLAPPNRGTTIAPSHRCRPSPAPEDRRRLPPYRMGAVYGGSL